MRSLLSGIRRFIEAVAEVYVWEEDESPAFFTALLDHQDLRRRVVDGDDRV